MLVNRKININIANSYKQKISGELNDIIRLSRNDVRKLNEELLLLCKKHYDEDALLQYADEDIVAAFENRTIKFGNKEDRAKAATLEICIKALSDVRCNLKRASDIMKSSNFDFHELRDILGKIYNRFMTKFTSDSHYCDKSVQVELHRYLAADCGFGIGIIHDQMSALCQSYEIDNRKTIQSTPLTDLVSNKDTVSIELDSLGPSNNDKCKKNISTIPSSKILPYIDKVSDTIEKIKQYPYDNSQDSQNVSLYYDNLKNISLSLKQAKIQMLPFIDTDFKILDRLTQDIYTGYYKLRAITLVYSQDTNYIPKDIELKIHGALEAISDYQKTCQKQDKTVPVTWVHSKSRLRDDNENLQKKIRSKIKIYNKLLKKPRLDSHGKVILEAKIKYLCICYRVLVNYRKNKESSQSDIEILRSGLVANSDNNKVEKVNVFTKQKIIGSEVAQTIDFLQHKYDFFNSICSYFKAPKANSKEATCELIGNNVLQLVSAHQRHNNAPNELFKCIDELSSLSI